MKFSNSGEMASVAAGDDMLLRPNQEFYIPEFAEHLSCVPQVIVKINRLGKCISPKFASRYFEEMAAGIVFHADSLEEKLAMEGLPQTQAYTFEGAGAMSGLQAFEPGSSMTFYRNGERIFSQKITDLPFRPSDCVSYASQYHLMKIGDLVFCGNNARFPIKQGDLLEMELGETKLECRIM